MIGVATWILTSVLLLSARCYELTPEEDQELEKRLEEVKFFAPHMMRKLPTLRHLNFFRKVTFALIQDYKVTEMMEKTRGPQSVETFTANVFRVMLPCTRFRLNVLKEKECAVRRDIQMKVYKDLENSPSMMFYQGTPEFWVSPKYFHYDPKNCEEPYDENDMILLFNTVYVRLYVGADEKLFRDPPPPTTTLVFLRLLGAAGENHFREAPPPTTTMISQDLTEQSQIVTEASLSSSKTHLFSMFGLALAVLVFCFVPWICISCICKCNKD